MMVLHARRAENISRQTQPLPAAAALRDEVELVLLPQCVVRSGRTADGRDRAHAASGYCDLNNNGINCTPAEAALRIERDQGTGGVAGLSVLSAVDRRRDESIQESM